MSSATLQGSLESFKLPDVLTFLNSSHKTGMLTLTQADNESYVFFRDGALVYAASNQEPRRRRLAKAIAGSRDEATMKIEVSEVIYDAFVWKSGAFAFFDSIDLPAEAVTIHVDLSNLIMEGARRISEWEECLRLLPDSSAVFRVTGNPESQEITLTAEEWKILFLVNGQRTLEDLCREADLDAFHVYRIVYGLLANKMIEPPEFDGEETIHEQTTELGEATVRDFDDDTALLVSEQAILSYREIVRQTTARILIMGGNDAGTVVPLVQIEYRIGRQRDNQIQLNDLGVSGYHARIFHSPDGFVVEDLKSRNGTWVNGKRITHAILQDGDEIRVGETDLRYETLFDESSPTLTK